jgi:hypothetical protein
MAKHLCSLTTAQKFAARDALEPLLRQWQDECETFSTLTELHKYVERSLQDNEKWTTMTYNVFVSLLEDSQLRPVADELLVRTNNNRLGGNQYTKVSSRLTKLEADVRLLHARLLELEDGLTAPHQNGQQP